MKRSASLYTDKINQVLRLLQREGSLVRYRLSKRNRLGNYFCYYLTVADLPKDIRVEFIPELIGEVKRSTNFFQVSLSSFPQAINVNFVRDVVKRQIRSRKRGSDSEAVAAHILSIMRRDEDIHDFCKTKEKEDMQGKDFRIWFFNSENRSVEMPLQIKSSKAGQEEHKARFPDIPSVRIERDCPSFITREKFFVVKDAYTRGEILHI